jgi:iron complex outermembrane receptor protein
MSRSLFRGGRRGGVALLSLSLSVPLALSLLPAAAASAQDAVPPAASGAIVGRVLAPSREAIGGSLVTVVGLRRQATTAADGAFRFAAVPPGHYLVRAESPIGHGVAHAEVGVGETVTVAITLELEIRDEVVVSAAADPRSQLEVVQPTTVLLGEELDLRREATLGATLDEQPGVSSTSFGPGASRPVIRGLGGDRIRVLTGGLGSADASNTSPDHAVSIDPLSAERVEVLRGPATLLYGSSAVGGVVNVLDGRIPDYLPEEGVSGRAEIAGGTVADERSGGVSLDGRGAGRLAWHADYLRRKTGDVEIPGFAEADHDDAAHEEGEHEDEEEAFGVLPNSALDSESAAVGASWVTERGFFGVSASGLDSFYGVPGHAHEEEGAGEGAEDEEEVRIDLRQRRFDFRGETVARFGPFRGAKVRLGVADYEHRELEGGEVGTRFTNDSWEGRVELVQRTAETGVGALTGSLGLQASRSDFVAAGEEAFVPPSVSDTAALFAFEEIARGPLRLQVGLRWETSEVDPAGALPERSFDGLSGSAGLVWELRDDVSLTASLSSTERLPTANELFADGPHAATRTFEIGDSDLDVEDSLGFDVTLKAARDRFRGEVAAFVNRFDGFIFESFTGEVRDGLEVVRFVQADAEFTGVEADTSFVLFERDDRHLDLLVRGDWVRAELADGSPLPRIPPVRASLGLSYHQDRWRGLVEARRVEEQDRVAANETPTGGHTLLNAMLGYRFFTDRLVTDLILRGTNLTDEEARNHVSLLKDEVPLPGRDLSLILRVSF